MMQIEISSNPDWIDIDRVWSFLCDEAYWSRGIPRTVVERSITHSLVWGAYEVNGESRSQVGFLRVVSDRTTFAYLCDVFVLPEWRGRGMAHRLLAAAHAHPDLQGLRRWLLFTRDAHVLYARAGFTPLANPLRGMERLDSDVYIGASTRQPGIDLSGELR